MATHEERLPSPVLPDESSELINVDSTAVDTLQKNAIGFPAVLYNSLAGAALLAAVQANIPFIAAQAGADVPLVFVIVGVGLLAFGVSIVYFSRKLSSAGGFYPWIRAGLGKGATFQAGWLMVWGYWLYTTSVIVLLGSLANTAVSTYLHLAVPGGWVLYALVAAVVAFGLAFFDIRVAARGIFIFMILEAITLVVLNVAIDLNGGPGGHSLVHTFTLAGGSVPGVAPGGWLGLFDGMVLGIWMFVGFETSAVYGEESRSPRLNVPRAIVVSLVLLVCVYIWSSYSAVIGFGWQHAADQLGKGAYTSYYTLATTYVGAWFAAVLTVLVITSNLACALVFVLAAGRYLYAMGREGILPVLFKRVDFGKTHGRWKSPHVALLVQGLLSIMLIVFLAFVTQKSNADGSTRYAFGVFGGGYTQTDGATSYLWLVTTGTMAILIIYVLVNIAAIAHAWRNRGAEKRERRSRLMGLTGLAVLSSLLFALPLLSFVLPTLPGAIGTYATSLGFAATPFPLNILPLIVLVWVLAGVCFNWWYVRRARPTNYEQIGLMVRKDA